LRWVCDDVEAGNSCADIESAAKLYLNIFYKVFGPTVASSGYHYLETKFWIIFS